MAEDTDTTWKLDLDNKEFIKKILESKESMLSLGDAKNLSGLTSGLLSAGVAVGALGVAFFAAKTIMDEVFEAENIKQINIQFEAMSKNVGIVGEELKKGLIDAAAGLADDTDLLKAANKALVEMGSNAAKLPEVMTLARQVSAVMGGEMTDRFEQLNQAIAMGNTRMLKHMGIKVDLKKAEENYAKQIGTTVNALSDAEKQEARMNAILTEGQNKFKGTDLNIKQATNAWTQLKVTLNELGEVTAYIFNTVFGEFVVKSLKLAGTAAKDFRNIVASIWGPAEEKDKLRLESLRKRLIEHQRAVEGSEAAKVAASKVSEEQIERHYDMTREKYISQVDAAIKFQKGKIAELQAEIDKIEAKHPKAKESPEDADARENKNRLLKEDAEKRREANDKEMAELHKLKMAAVDLELKNAETIEDVDRLSSDKKILIEQETQDQIKKIKEQAGHALISPELANAEILAAEEMKATRIKEIDDQLAQNRIKAVDLYANHSKSVNDGIVRGWKAAAAEVNNDNKAMGEIGKAAFNAVKKNSHDAFMAIGSGAKSGGEALKGFFFSSLGDIAEASGNFHLAQGLASFNPVEIAEAGVLLALAGALKAAGGGGGWAFFLGGGGGGGGGAAGGGPVAMEQAKPEAAQMAEKKTVTIAIQGNYFETEQTQTRLMEMIRSTQDATDFNLTKISP